MTHPVDLQITRLVEDLVDEFLGLGHNISVTRNQDRRAEIIDDIVRLRTAMESRTPSQER